MTLLAERHPQWAGESLTYSGAHQWLNNKHRALKIKCEFCGSKNRKLQWAKKKGHKYTRHPEDYHVLCISCHKKYDLKGWINPLKGKLRKRKLIICGYCKKDFLPPKKASVFCSTSCSKKSTAKAHFARLKKDSKGRIVGKL